MNETEQIKSLFIFTFIIIENQIVVYDVFIDVSFIINLDQIVVVVFYSYSYCCYDCVMIFQNGLIAYCYVTCSYYCYDYEYIVCYYVFYDY